MFKSKTVFVVGAGCSKELGFPLGNELKEKIARLVNISFVNGYDLSSGDSTMADALNRYAHSKGQDQNAYYTAGRVIARALPLAISIDNFLEAHEENEQIVTCGKFGIARAILQAEAASRLRWEPGDKPLDFSQFADTWLVQLMRYLTENVAKGNIDGLFENVSFIIFNYDRCIETFLWHALQSYYSIGAAKVEEILSKATFHHPYGTVGRLPWQQSGFREAKYGDTQAPLPEIAHGIRTFSEQIADEHRAPMLKDLTGAHILVFLGFSFIQQNMKLLAISEKGRASKIFATALGLSESDCSLVKGQLHPYLLNNTATIELRNNLTAAGLFSEYSKSITQS